MVARDGLRPLSMPTMLDATNKQAYDEPLHKES